MLHNDILSEVTKLNLTVFRGIDHDMQAADLYQTKRILFYNPANFQNVRNVLKMSHFERCPMNNCLLTFDKREVNFSDAVIFNWRHSEPKSPPKCKRPKDQVWIFIQHESPASYQRHFPKFNWTMTYSKHSDIYLPYGMIKVKEGETPNRDYIKIAQNKSKDALWIVSHCNTAGKRELYVKTLQKYITVDILGACGQRWKCGRAHNHDSGNCFDLLNSTYRYYLAFENAICHEYITEKFFENYKYDLIQIVRGGDPNSRPINISEKAFISTADFSNAHELGKYLKRLSGNITEYAKLLEQKDRYFSVSYEELIQNAMCDVCQRLNKLDEYRFTYENMHDWMTSKYPCLKPKDI